MIEKQNILLKSLAITLMCSVAVSNSYATGSDDENGGSTTRTTVQKRLPHLEREKNVPTVVSQQVRAAKAAYWQKQYSESTKIWDKLLEHPSARQVINNLRNAAAAHRKAENLERVVELYKAVVEHAKATAADEKSLTEAKTAKLIKAKPTKPKVSETEEPIPYTSQLLYIPKGSRDKETLESFASLYELLQPYRTNPILDLIKDIPSTERARFIVETNTLFGEIKSGIRTKGEYLTVGPLNQDHLQNTFNILRGIPADARIDVLNKINWLLTKTWKKIEQARPYNYPGEAAYSDMGIYLTRKVTSEEACAKFLDYFASVVQLLPTNEWDKKTLCLLVALYEKFQETEDVKKLISNIPLGNRRNVLRVAEPFIKVVERGNFLYFIKALALLPKENQDNAAATALATVINNEVVSGKWFVDKLGKIKLSDRVDVLHKAKTFAEGTYGKEICYFIDAITLFPKVDLPRATVALTHIIKVLKGNGMYMIVKDIEKLHQNDLPDFIIKTAQRL